MTTTENAAERSKTSTPLFLHAQFQVPSLLASSNANENHHDLFAQADASNETGGGVVGGGVGIVSMIGETHNKSEETSTLVVNQWFDASNCQAAVIGLPGGVEPSKVRCLSLNDA